MENLLVLQIDDLIFDKSIDENSLRIYHRHLDIDFRIDDLAKLRNFLAIKPTSVKLTDKQITDINKS